MSRLGSLLYSFLHKCCVLFPLYEGLFLNKPPQGMSVITQVTLDPVGCIIQPRGQVSLPPLELPLLTRMVNSTLFIFNL